jgi:hypothetical protein
VPHDPVVFSHSSHGISDMLRQYFMVVPSLPSSFHFTSQHLMPSLQVALSTVRTTVSVASEATFLI